MPTHEEKPEVNKAAVGILVVVILLVAGGVVASLVIFKPRAEAKVALDDVPRVEVVETELKDFQVKVATQGVVVARTETKVASEVSGKVVDVADQFGRGAAFEKGDVLLEIDPADYETAILARKSEVEEAKIGVLRAEVEVEKGRREWARLGRGGEPNPLVLGIPQLERATAILESVEAALEKAERDLERTKIKAPYRGRVRATTTDLGSYVTVGTPLAELFATDVLEVRLPVSEADYGFLDEVAAGAEVAFLAGGQAVRGKVVRVEGEIDGKMRSRHLIAEIEGVGVVPGQFVEGRIAGETLEGVMELPRRAIHGRNRVLVARATDGREVLEFRTAEIVRKEKEVVLIRPGDVANGALGQGMKVIVTPLAAPINGMAVKVIGEAGEKVMESEVPG